MKPFYTLFWMLCFGTALTAQTANINVFSTQEVNFYVYLDGKLQHTDPKKNVRITDIPEGNCTVKVEFYNEGIAAVQTHSKLISKKETAFMILFNGGEGVTFNEYSCVPMNEVNIQSSVSQYSYSREGLTKNPNAKAEEKTDIYAGQKQYGVLSAADIEARRMGQIKFVDSSGMATTKPNTNNTNTTATAEPVRENGKTEVVTEVKSYRTKTDEAGNQKILCERLITTTTTIYENGMEMVGTEDVKRTSTTAFTCMPRGDAEFNPALKTVETAANKLEEAKKISDKQCLAPDQITAIANLLTDENQKKEYAVFAKPFCAHPTEYPLQSLLPADVVVVEKPVEPVVVVVEKPVEPAVVVVENNTTNTTDNPKGKKVKAAKVKKEKPVKEKPVKKEK